jgi:hypothetical protein
VQLVPSSVRKGTGAIIGGLAGAGVGAGTGAIIDGSKKLQYCINTRLFHPNETAFLC